MQTKTTNGLARIADGGDPTIQGDDIRKYFADNKQAIETLLINDAKEVQDACNAVAVALLLHNIGKVLYRIGYSGNTAPLHPAFKSVIGKLCSLALIEHNGTDAYDSLYNYKG